MEFPPDHSNGTERRRVGLVYDERMCKHSAPKREIHPENPDHIRAVGTNSRLLEFLKGYKLSNFKKRNWVAAEYNSIYFNEGSSESAYLAAGSVLEVAEKVAKGELNSAFAIVRPPEHHAEESKPMGFCLFNNVSIATSFLLNQKVSHP
ncbi:putative histone deacetylase [Helianthus annuus]|nr:putative histone deacetylase [Helianthus annuus]